jgi:hypothetical protein
MTSPLEMILGVNYFYLCKKLDFDVIWPGRPLFDLKLIKGHWFCINREKVLSFFHHHSSHTKCGLKFVPYLGVIG